MKLTNNASLIVTYEGVAKTILLGIAFSLISGVWWIGLAVILLLVVEIIAVQEIYVRFIRRP